jgi:signal transduction histidine kinase/ActR/RegA family two-component response regulator
LICKPSWVSCTFLICLLPLSLAGQPPERVRIGLGYSVPWGYLSPEGTPTGFYVEVFKEAARREGIDIEIVFRRDGPEASLAADAIDLWAAAVPTPERRLLLHFSDPWWSQDHYLGVLAAGPIRSLADTAGRSVVHSSSPPFTVPLQQVLPGARLVPMNDLRQRFATVCDGRADAVLFYHETSLFAVTGSNEMADCRERGLRLIPLGQPVMEVSIAALPSNAALAARFRARLAEMAADQTLARLSAFPLTGDQSVTRLLQASDKAHRQRVLELSVAFLLAILLLGAVAYIRLRRATISARRSLATANDALRVKSDFLATISHEIRTPMTAVVGYMDMLLATPLRHDQRRFASEVLHATESLLTLINSILSFSRPASHPVPDSPFAPADVIDDCVAAVLLSAEEKRLDFFLEVDPALPARLVGDPIPLRQSLLNLLNNAVKFTSSGSIRLHAIYLDGVLECVVSDTGIGIPFEHRDRIFEPFTQIESSDSRRFGGIGLGLAIVADLCRRNGGSITLAPGSPAGSSFTLRLPFGAPPDAPSWLASFTPSSPSVAVIAAAPSPHIATLELYLRSAGWRVDLLSSLDALQSWRPPLDSRVVCMLDGASFGPTPPAWASSGLTPTVLLGSIRYFSRLHDAEKLRFNAVLSLPVTARALDESLGAAAAVHRPVAALPPLNVLVVDDNAVNRRVLSALLRNLGCQTDTAAGGREALAALLHQSYDIIFMDCQMPEMNGYETVAEIRRRPGPAAIVPICGVSASLDPDIRRLCLAAGMNEFLPKPVTQATLRAVLLRLAPAPTPS